MPLSFVSILGGTVTLMGTSTNLVVHGEAMSRGFDELGMFSITPLGLICLAVGLLYLFTAGRVLLPRRIRPPDLSAKYDVRRFVTELHVPEDSPANGRTLGDWMWELGWGERYDVTVLDIERERRGDHRAARGPAHSPGRHPVRPGIRRAPRRPRAPAAAQDPAGRGCSTTSTCRPVEAGWSRFSWRPAPVS